MTICMQLHWSDPATNISDWQDIDVPVTEQRIPQQF